MMVAFARALADRGFTTVPGFRDPVARRLLSPVWRLFYRLASRSVDRAATARRERGVAQLDAITLRVAKIDAEIEAAVAHRALRDRDRACRQLVLLGAGLDTRAFRLDSLAGVDVFEVDHPATQAYKRRKTAALLPHDLRARSLAFVPVDFERDSLADALEKAGFRADIPAVWAWEGVVMYLTDDAVRRTLADIASASCPGSVVVLNYHEPAELEKGAASRSEDRAIRLLLSFWREPQIGLRPRAKMQAMVRDAGFDVDSDTSPFDWAEHLGSKPPAGRVARISRLLVGARRAN
jgi:methyltransferase (TIGR00027 family)